MQKLTTWAVLTALLLSTPSLAAAQTLAVEAPAAAEEKAKEEKKNKQEKKPPLKVSLAGGTLMLPVPGEWKKVPLRNRLIETEFAIPGAKEKAPAGRFTALASGGSVNANVDRWVGQFKRHKKPAKGKVGDVKQMEIDGMKAHLVDISGDYMDAPRGPFGPKVEKKDYRMMAVMLETKTVGNYFFKLYGPEKLIDQHAEAFVTMVKGIKLKKDKE